ncbi:hypothetical protein BC831DRAFT_458071 [Entophlyctis helioformis]|nr:hypothetical protein BC831DRAFT_458071 [Entophlyctis helioformis]
MQPRLKLAAATIAPLRLDTAIAAAGSARDQASAASTTAAASSAKATSAGASISAAPASPRTPHSQSTAINTTSGIASSAKKPIKSKLASSSRSYAPLDSPLKKSDPFPFFGPSNRSLRVHLYAQYAAITGSSTAPQSPLAPHAKSAASTLLSTLAAMRPLGPTLLWLLLFVNCKYIPAAIRPAINVTTLPWLDSLIFGTSLGLLGSAMACVAVGYAATRSHKAAYCAFLPLILASLHEVAATPVNPVFDLLFFLPYGVLHYISPVLFAVWLKRCGPSGSAGVFLSALGWQNLAGVVTQIVLPCAAPWYNDKYGTAAASYSLPGDPAGLANVDKLFGTHMYTTTFNSSPLVFGAMPSLHSGFAFLIMLFAVHVAPRRAALPAMAYVLWMWTATMYFRHHYMVDLVAGGLYAFVAYWSCRRSLGGVSGFALLVHQLETPPATADTETLLPMYKSKMADDEHAMLVSSVLVDMASDTASTLIGSDSDSDTDSSRC